MSGLGLLLAFALLPLHPLGPTWQAVRVLPSGQALPGTAASALGPKDLAGIDHIWHWSASAAPERVAAAAWRGEPPRPSRDRLMARVAGVSAERPLSGFVVVAAPSSMWREVPEDFLPRWPVSSLGLGSIPLSRGEPWRARLLGPAEGGWWTDIEPAAKEVLLTRHAAPPAALSIVGAGGQPASAAVLQVLEPSRPEEGALRKIAAFATDAGGNLGIASLPSLRSVTWLAGDPESSPWRFEGRPEDLPRVIVLPAGASVSGRFSDARGRPLAEVAVRIEAWVAPGVPVPMARGTRTDEQGAWKLGGLPPGKARIQARRDGFATYQEQILLPAEALHLGNLRLEPAASLTFEVIDDRGEPVPGAIVRREGGTAVSTDASGLAALRDLPAQGTFSYAVTAADHLPALGSAAASAEAVTVELERAFLLLGRLVDRQGRRIADGTLALTSGHQSRHEGLGTDGGFRLALTPGRETALTLRSPRSVPLTLGVAPGQAGEVRDLGDLLAPAGATMTGRLIHAGTGEPVAGGRVWLPRPGPGGPALAWLHRDLVEAASDAGGRFRAEGLSPGVGGVLRIDVPGLARKHLMLSPLAEEESRDLGEIFLDEGSLVEVMLEDGAGALALESTVLARLDLRGEGLEQDSLTLPISGGRATFRQVPAGAAALEVTDDRTVLCQLEVEVPAAGSHLRLECPSRPMRVEGVVELGGEPATGGFLIWQPPAEAHPLSIAHYRLPSGLSTTRVPGGARPQPQMEVGADGRFVTRDLYPGLWEARYYSAPGEPAASQRVELPRRAEHWITLSYEASELQGRVVDEAGEPVGDARVQERATGLTTFARADGTFAFHGLRAGRYVFEARATVAGEGELRSELLPLAVEPGLPPETLELVVRRDSRGALAIEVSDTQGQPAAAQLVFVELDGRELQVLTTGAAGLARATLPRPLPARVRAAALIAGSWALGDWVNAGEAVERGLRLAPANHGQLLLRTSHAAGAPQILAPQGWDLTRLLTWLGLRPWVGPDQPLALAGLPGGTYTVSLAQAATSIFVETAESSEAWLDRP